MSSSIKKKGIAATKYFDNAIAQVFDNKFTQDVTYAIISDFAVKAGGKIAKEIKGK